MHQTVLSSRRAGQTAKPRLPRVRDMAVAGLLALALLVTLVRLDDDESCVVSLADIETVIVVSLPAGEIAPQQRLADASEPAAAPAAVVVALPPAAAAPPRGIDFMRGLASVVGIASTYNPFRSGADAAIAPTASGEAYDPESWTAAIQIDRRHDFGGVRYGRLYRPAFALVERGDKRAIVRINDVGPLRPGRVIDLNERSMRYFDPSLRLGLVHDMKITLLPGDGWTPGPVSGDERIGLASAM